MDAHVASDALRWGWLASFAAKHISRCNQCLSKPEGGDEEKEAGFVKEATQEQGTWLASIKQQDGKEEL